MYRPHLDRRVFAAAGAGTIAGGNTTWTLPFNVATDGTEGSVCVVDATTGEFYPTTRPSITTVTVPSRSVTGAVWIGVLSAAEVRLSPTILVRRDLGIGDTRGRLTLRDYRFDVDQSMGMTVTIEREARAPEVREFRSTTPVNTRYRVSVLHDAEKARLTVRSLDALPLRLTSGEAVFTFSPRTRGY